MTKSSKARRDRRERFKVIRREIADAGVEGLRRSYALFTSDVVGAFPGQLCSRCFRFYADCGCHRRGED